MHVNLDLAFVENVEYLTARTNPSHSKYSEWKKRDPSANSVEDIWDASCYKQMIQDMLLLGILQL